MEPTPPPEPPENRASKIADHLQWFFGFLILSTGYYFVTRPATTTQQLVFRLAMLAIGISGSIGVLVWRLTARR